VKERQQFAHRVPVGRSDPDRFRTKEAEGSMPFDASENGAANLDVWRDFIRMLRRSAERPR
jgi:hypothetical protein